MAAGRSAPSRARNTCRPVACARLRCTSIEVLPRCVNAARSDWQAFPAESATSQPVVLAQRLPGSVRYADHIIVDSEATRHDVLALLGVDDERISVVQLGVDERFKPQPQAVIDAIRSKHNLPEKFILYLGTMEPRKGIDTLVDAVAALPAERIVLSLLLAGKKGWYWDCIQERIHSIVCRIALSNSAM